MHPNRIILRRSTTSTFGQDYRASAAMQMLNLVPADKEAGVYKLTCDPKTISLLISFNSESPADAALISSLPANIPVIIHYQLQPTFLEPERQERVARVLKRAVCVIVPAKFLCSELGRVFGIFSTSVVRNGVDASIFQPKSDVERLIFRRAFDIPPDAKLIAYAGRLTPAKGFEALYCLLRTLPEDTVLIIRTYHENHDLLRKLLATNPRQVRIQIEDGDRLNHPIPFADCALILSLSEVAPLVGSEALMSGVPLITTSCTPFYDELSLAGFGLRDLRRIAFAPTTYGRPHQELHLEKDEAEQLAEKAVNMIQDLSPLNFDERVALSAHAIRAGLSQQKMLQEYAGLYDRFERVDAT